MKFDEQVYKDIVSQTRFIVERLRIFARVFLIGYLYILTQMIDWATGLESLNNAQTGLISTIVGIATPITKFYTDTGKELYDTYDTFEYKYPLVKWMDRIGFLMDRWRIFPIVFVSYFIWSLYGVISWGMGLGDELTNQQATFIGTYATSASLVLGFFINTKNVNLKLEKDFIKRVEVNDEDINSKDSEEKQSNKDA